MSELRAKLTEKLTGVLDGVKDDLAELWKLEVREAMEDLAELTLQKLAISDPHELASVERELLHAQARVANWTFVGADLVRARLKAVLHELAEGLGAVLRGFIK